MWRGLLLLALLYVLGAGIAPLVRADRWVLGTALTYAPRILVALGAMVLCLLFLRGRRPASAGVSLVGAGLLVGQLGWGGGPLPVPEHHLNILSHNAHHAAQGAEPLNRLVRDHAVDIVCLQELQPDQRAPYIEALEGFRIFVPDESAHFERDYYGPFSSLIAVSEERLDAGEVTVETAITGYRTFAVRVVLDGVPLWIVNVHTTKPMSFRGGPLRVWRRTAHNAYLHAREHERLATWVADHADEPVILAGDFNAPIGTEGLRLPGTSDAHTVAGRGWHRTFPVWLPSWGLDHVLGNEHVSFSRYATFDPGTSDHLAQLASFGIVAPR
jgi:endonuclease/exonuclease/phosphatase (EEP) superfamily protein YafD